MDARCRIALSVRAAARGHCCDVTSLLRRVEGDHGGIPVWAGHSPYHDDDIEVEMGYNNLVDRVSALEAASRRE